MFSDGWAMLDGGGTTAMLAWLLLMLVLAGAAVWLIGRMLKKK